MPMSDSNLILIIAFSAAFAGVLILFFLSVFKLKKDYKKLEELLKERTRKLDQETDKLLHVTQNMTEGAILLDTSGKIVFANNESRNILGGELGNMIGSLEKKFSKSKAKEHLTKCVQNEPSTIAEAETDGEIYSISFQCLQMLKGLYYGHLIWMRNITEEKQLERAKSEFVAVASHQLRTPATVIKGNIELLRDESFGMRELSKDQTDILDQIDLANDRMIRLVNDMLDVSKIERGEIEFKSESVNMQDLLESIMEDLVDYSKKYGVRIKYSKSSNVMPSIVADEMRVRQVFQNLIDNAIRYSRHPGGKVEVSFNIKERTLETKIEDNGIGIPNGEKAKIFQRFYRASNAVKFSSGGGTGLGLYMAKGIIEKSGGKIWFESEEGKGTTFYFTLPIKS